MLYKALHPEDTNATADDIRDVTIHNVLTDGIYNDLGFLLGTRLVILVEAQSTWSPNIVVRSLMYFAKTYNAYFKEHEQNLYGGKPVSLPRPELYIIYTGSRYEHPDHISLKETFFPDGKCALDVRAEVLYDGKQGDIINQYVTFAHVFDAQVRRYGRTRQALDKTIRICMDKDVLKNFLDERKVEIMDYVWDMTDEEIEEQYRRSLVKEAVAENTAENARNFAIRMLEDGKCSIDDIARYAGLPVEEVERLSRLQLA